MKDFLLILALVIYIIFGYYTMWLIDKEIAKYKKNNRDRK